MLPQPMPVMVMPPLPRPPEPKLVKSVASGMIASHFDGGPVTSTEPSPPVIANTAALTDQLWRSHTQTASAGKLIQVAHAAYASFNWLTFDMVALVHPVVQSATLLLLMWPIHLPPSLGP